ncbi:hypothetical protein ACF08W_28760 [Streptomyces sp. NPDC015144]|uniref:hypothetical protein n=1 Tax=Streptomyces sp. NPDC015144 TaxID=3364944 RepID=UPI0036F6CD32
MTTVIDAPPRTAATVFDLEGGLVDVSAIHGLARDASRFHSAMLECPPHLDVVAAARSAHQAGETVLVMTSGDRRLERRVITWLARHGVPAALLLMRSRNDFRPSAVVKRERLRAAHYRFECLSVWSADPSVTRLSEQDGIDVVPLPGYWGDLS